MAVLEDDLPLPTAVGTPSEGWTFITSTCWTEADIPNAALIVDGNGTPGWWRRLAKKGFDVRLAPDGRITWMGRTEELPNTLQNLVLGPDGGYDGHHLVGFGSLVTNAKEERVPTVTELDVDGQEIWNLLPPDGCWTYRAWRFEGDPMAGWNP